MMDLEEFEDHDRRRHTTTIDATGSLSVPDALKWIDAEWHAASRQARWMDLLGDYAGIEPFIIDGHSLIQFVIDDPLLALGRSNDPSFQILHAFHTLEGTLDEFIKRSAAFDVVFWEESRYLALQTGVGDFMEAPRSLARRLLFDHLLKIRQVSVYVFTGLSDPKWREYQLLRKPMFVLVDDGTADQNLTDAFAAQRLLCHRVFLCWLLSSGLALALLSGAEFRDSKVLSFVYEPRSPRANDFIPIPIRDAYSTAVLALEGQAKNVPLTSSPTSIEPLPALRTLMVEDVALKMASLRKSSDARDKALFFAFIVHLVLLPRLSLQDRARRLEPMRPEFNRYLTRNFFPPAFRTLEMAMSSLNTTMDIDMRVFVALVRFLAENNTRSSQDLLGKEVFAVMQSKLSQFSVSLSTFSQFATAFRLEWSTFSSPPTGIQTQLGLLPFSNKIFDEELAPILSLSKDDGTKTLQVEDSEDDEGLGSEEESDADEWDTSSEEEATAPKPGAPSEAHNTGYFDDGTLFHEPRRSHNPPKPSLPKPPGGEAPRTKSAAWLRKMKLRSDQRFMKTLHDQAATLTGASGAALHQIKILPVRAAPSQSQLPSKSQKHSHARPAASKATQKQSKADAIREQNLAQKAQKQHTESVVWLTKRIRDLDSETTLLTVEKSISDLKRNPRSNEPFVATEFALYRLHRLFQHWILDPERESPLVRDKHGVTALRAIKDIFDLNYSTKDIRKCIEDVLNVLGFSSYTDTLTVALTTQEDRPLSFKFVKLFKSKTREPLHAFMRVTEHPIEWQLRVFGEYMDRSLDSQVDPRVSFRPDAWQRQVLDAIDEHKSLLVVAPTSAGKTFISYYAMEKVLRGSDDGVIVYVAPSKALVTQVAAEIYARFSKDLNGRSCWAIYTREYRIHEPDNCQILVTIPEMLANMMLSPPLAKVWTPRVKYIILDEIHSIGQQEGGSAWEQILLLAPCPVIGLSATVGAPEKFNTWLEAIQKAGGFQHAFVHHPHRYSHLRKFFYNIHEKPRSGFEAISTYKSTTRMRFLHPIAILAFGPTSIPLDLELEASDTLSLYRALTAHGDLPPSTLGELNPLKFFPSNRLLQQKDVIAYDTALKACLAPMVARFDLRDTVSPLHKVVASLEDKALARTPTEVINAQPERATFKENLIHLICDLHVQGDLPAIFFNFDRTSCEIMAATVLEVLVAKEDEWRASNPEWKRRLTQYEEWLSRSKDREREAARAAKNKADPDEVKTETAEWQATFDPDAPLTQFSFAGQHTSFTQSMLEEELRWLARVTPPSLLWILDCLRRGIAVHHSGMNRHYRTTVESLFRRGFIRVVFATDTLALGINAPTKTSIFCGDSPYLTALMYRQCAGRAGRRGYDLLGKVVFYGLPMNRVQRLTLSKLPSLRANLPVSSTLVLRLFNLLEGSGYAPAAVNAVQHMFRLPQVSLGSEESKHQLLYHLRFSIDYLRRARLLDEQGRPFRLFSIASRLLEPSNFALVALLRQGVLHRICAQHSLSQAKLDFILLMSQLFGRRYLPRSYREDEHTHEVAKTSGSKVILPPLLESAQRVLAMHEEEIVKVYTSFVLTRGAELGPDTSLALSGTEVGGTPAFYAEAQFGAWLRETALNVVARSLFVANSGHDDRFESVADLAQTARKELRLTEHVAPSLGDIWATSADRRDGFPLNAYLVDFYVHGSVRELSEANAIRRGEVWYLLQEFDGALVTIRGVLEQLIARRGGEASEGDDGESEGLDDLDSGMIELEGPAGEDDGEDEREGHAGSGGTRGVRPGQVVEGDWKVLKVVHEATEEFHAKFKAMWA